MDLILSVKNDTVKEAVKLQQKKYRKELFLLEGLKPIEEAVNCGLKIDKIFVNQSKTDLIKKFDKFKLILTSDAVLQKISTTETAPDIIAIAYQKKYSIQDILGLEKIVLLENIKDAGNLGTIVRSAKALGFDALVLYGNTVDVYNPKTVRSAVGNLWKLPIVNINDYNVLKNNFEKFNKIATLPKSKNNLSKCSFKSPILLMFGSEADGLSEELIKFSNSNVKIEMDGSVESLNLSVSAGIIMYQISSKQMMF